jgi:hypothetical protein
METMTFAVVLTSARLETAPSMAYVSFCSLNGPGEPRVRIPVKRFLARPFYRTDT